MDRTDPLPAGVYYHSQILGLEVVEVGGRGLGEVSEILETGGNDVYVVRTANGAELLLPAISSVILDIDLEAKQIRVAIPQGLEEGK
jgi:16S rRNA processing protein RimM